MVSRNKRPLRVGELRWEARKCFAFAVATATLFPPTSAFAAAGSTDVTVRGIAEPAAEVATLAQTGVSGMPWVLVIAGAALALASLRGLVILGRRLT